MITETILESAKKNICRSGLRTVIYNDLIKNGIYNKKNGRPFSKYTIDKILRGSRENVIIEKAIMDLLNEMKSKREGIEKEYKESHQQGQPNTLN
jgi:hypothetical protein